MLQDAEIYHKNPFGKISRELSNNFDQTWHAQCTYACLCYNNPDAKGQQ